MKRFKKVWYRFENFIWEHQRGIFGAIAFHILVAIILMILKINTTAEAEKAIVIEFEPEELEQLLPEPSDEKNENQENNGSEIDIHNLAKDANAEPKVKQIFDIDKYISDVQKDLDSENPKPNYESEIEKLQEELAEVLKEKQKDSTKEDYVFTGNTAIVFDIKNRKKDYLKIPVYMCEGSGKVTLEVNLNQAGQVIAAHVLKEKSTTTDPCFLETAIKAAKASKFNADLNAPTKQKGSITYFFIAQ